MVLKSSRHNVCTGNTVRSKWAHSKHEFHPVIRKSVLGSGDCDGDMFDITSGYVRCGDEYFLDDGCLETGPSIQGTLLYSLNKRGRWKIPTLLARTPSRPTGRTGRTDASRREQGNENLIAKAHHFLSKQASCYQCFSVKPLGGSSGWTPNQTGLTEKERLKATRQRTMALSRRKDHKKRVPVDEEEEDPMVQLLDRTGQRPEVQYDVCLTCPSSPLQVDLEDDRSCRPLQTTSRKLKYSHTNVLSQFQEYMDAEDDMMEDIFDWAIYDSLNDSPLPNTSLPPNDPPSPVDDDVKLNNFVDANDFQLGDLDSDLLCGIEVIEGDLQTDGEPEPARIGALLGDWVTPGPRKGGNGKRNKHRKSSVEGGWEFVDKEELCGVQDWEVVPNHGRL